MSKKVTLIYEAIQAMKLIGKFVILTLLSTITTCQKRIIGVGGRDAYAGMIGHLDISK